MVGKKDYDNIVLIVGSSRGISYACLRSFSSRESAEIIGISRKKPILEAGKDEIGKHRDLRIDLEFDEAAEASKTEIKNKKERNWSVITAIGTHHGS
ncbi:MAG: hypothetical protein MI748_21210 [Opitutales bacterium]|nr:hypothetical protein [Opitutales bacterium]